MSAIPESSNFLPQGLPEKFDPIARAPRGMINFFESNGGFDDVIRRAKGIKALMQV